MRQQGRAGQVIAFCTGAAVAILAADALMILVAGAAPGSSGLLRHVEFLATLMALVGVAGVLGLTLPPRRTFATAPLAAMGALAAIAGFAIGAALVPALGETISIVAIVLAAAAVPRIAALWPRAAR